jgi:hypothetical protein
VRSVCDCVGVYRLRPGQEQGVHIAVRVVGELRAGAEAGQRRVLRQHPGLLGGQRALLRGPRAVSVRLYVHAIMLGGIVCVCVMCVFEGDCVFVKCECSSY